MRQKIVRSTGLSRLTRLAQRFPLPRQLQKAQGMVEFALVLPILLMLLFGIIAFSHLFFVYSMTVSASREAARWGAAVGITGSGVPRYRDCQSIRDAAVRAGGIVGVKSESVVIQYDRGPDKNHPGQALAPYNTCPATGQEPFGPIESDVHLGDRILVTVNINYQPIVPLINIPARTLTASTARTIIKSLPVGDAPEAEDPCGQTAKELTEFTPALPLDPTTLLELPAGDILNVKYTVIVRETGLGAPGSDTLTDSGSLHTSGSLPAGTQQQVNWFWTEPYIGQEFDILLDYQSGAACPGSFSAPKALGRIKIGKANTKATIIGVTPEPSVKGTGVNVTVQVDKAMANLAAATGPIGTGSVEVRDDLDHVVCTITSLNPANGQGQCTLPPMISLGLHHLTATYLGTAQYNPSSPSTPVDHIVIDYTKTPTPTSTISATFTPTPTVRPAITKTPTKTLLPPWCPSASGLDFNGLNSILLTVNNPNITGAGAPVTLTSAYINWVADSPVPVLEELRFGPDTSASCKAGGPCIWSGGQKNSPVIIGAGGLPFSNPSLTTLQRGETKQMRFTFSRNLNNGIHNVTLIFNNNCILELTGDRELPQ